VDQRDKAEYEAFLAAAWPRLFRTAHALMGNPHDAEDVLQDAFAKAYGAWPRVSQTPSPEAYVRGILANTAASSWRHRWRKVEVTTGVSRDSAAHIDPDAVETSDLVWRAIRELPPRQRTIVVLRYFDDLSEQQIAETLGLARGSVKSQASAAMTSLRRLLPADMVIGTEGST
jgi:RNA polymerase sigma-70 factor (sigma-E family)